MDRRRARPASRRHLHRGDRPALGLVEASGPVAVRSLIEGFRRWGTDTTNAIVDKIEVDEPAYLRAYVTAGDKRWRVVLSLEPSSMKLDFLQWDVMRDAGTGNAR